MTLDGRIPTPNAIIDVDGIRPFPHMSPTMERLYDKFLEDPFRVVPVHELQTHLQCSHYTIYKILADLRHILERENLGTIHNKHSAGYHLR